MKIFLRKEIVAYVNSSKRNINRPFVEYHKECYFLIEEVDKWLLENNISYDIICEFEWLKIVILDKKDAMLFKLVWG